MELLEEHIRNMYEWSSPESVHALDLAKLRVPEITFWTVWQDGALMGCGALKELSRTQEYRADPKAGRPWSEVRGQLLAKLRRA
jgi:hypothetical protein